MEEMIEIISKIIFSQGFITIFTGVTIFIISQYFLELFLKPRMKLNDAYSIFSRALLLFHSNYKNGTLKPEQIETIKLASTGLVAQAWITFKSKSKRENFLKISREINSITSQSMIEKKDFKIINNAVKEIEKLDRNIKITYE